MITHSRDREGPFAYHLTSCNTDDVNEYTSERRVRIEEVELDDRNIAHATSRVSVVEIYQVFNNDPEFRRNRSGATADYAALGVTDGGSRVRINFIYDPTRRTARPVSAWRLS